MHTTSKCPRCPRSLQPYGHGVSWCPRCGTLGITDETGVPRHFTATVTSQLVPEALRMREQQIKYFRTKSVGALDAAKACETRVDQMLGAMRGPPSDEQQRLF